MKTLLGRAGVLVLGSVACAGCRQELPSERIVESDPPVIAAVRPPALAGGTLLVTRNAMAVVSDPDRDRVVVVGVDGAGRREIALEAGDEPGRSVEDEQGLVHVAMRRSGDVVSIDPATATIRGRRQVCGGPRGIAYRASTDELLVACADGQLVKLAADPDVEEVSRVFIEPDLRDVLVDDAGTIRLTTFRSAEILGLNTSNEVGKRVLPPSDDGMHEPHVAYRTFALEGGATLMAHQMERASTIDVETSPEVAQELGIDEGAYVPFDCTERLVRDVVTIRDAKGTRQLAGASFSDLRLVIDVAVSGDGTHFAVVDPVTGVAVESNVNDPLSDGCGSEDTGVTTPIEKGTPIGLAYAGDSIVVQTREPSTLVTIHRGEVQGVIDLGGDSVADTGFDLFYNLGELKTSSGLACASCHPEGREDGHTWNFSDVGPRRTQSLAGTIAGTAPFHWGGDLPDLNSLMDEVFTTRMAGPRESAPRVKALQSWIESIPAVRAAPVGPDESREHGRELFESEGVGCASCHSGSAFTSNDTVSIGRGDALQVPSLIGVGTRAPFMHNGCANTMLERFDPNCGGDEHGDTSQLDEASLLDLVRYTNSL